MTVTTPWFEEKFDEIGIQQKKSKERGEWPTTMAKAEPESLEMAARKATARAVAAEAEAIQGGLLAPLGGPKIFFSYGNCLV